MNTYRLTVSGGSYYDVDEHNVLDVVQVFLSDRGFSYSIEDVISVILVAS